MKRSYSLAFLFFVTLTIASRAQTSGSTINAATCNESDVAAVISGPTHTAVNGDTIVIPAGTCTWTGMLSINAGITLMGSGTPNTGPSTFGAGSTSTVVVDNAGSNGPLINITASYGQTVRLSTLDIEPASSSTSLYSPISAVGSCTSSGCPNIRIDNINYGHVTAFTESGNGAQGTSMIRTDNVFGVMDHNTVNSTVFANNSDSAYLGVGAWGDNSWAQPDSFGTANALYMENNIFNVQEDVTDMEFYANGGGIGGVRQVGRFNHINTSAGAFYAFGGHGLDTLGRGQGMRQLEVYGNTNTCSGSGGCGDGAATFRAGGTGIIFGNTLTASSGNWFNQVADFSIYRNVYGATNGWGYCGGGSPFDTNDGVTYYSGTMNSVSGSAGGPFSFTDSSKSWTTNQLSPAGSPYSVYDSTQGFYAEIASNTSTTVTTVNPVSESTWYSTGFAAGDNYQILRSTVCADQGGRGAGVYVSGTTPSPSGPLNQALDPVYEFADTLNGSVNGYFSDNDNNRLIANRDFYTDSGSAAQTSASSPFNGTTGVGHGTLANRPSSCTTGVAYWATDQGTWNTSGNGFGQGVLYKCTSTNTWSVFYTPYTYPHPLTSGGSVLSPAPPVNVTGSAGPTS